MKLLCWEGYESDSILGEFSRQHQIQSTAQTLLSDTATAHSLLNGGHEHWDVLNINNPWVRDFLCQHQLIQTLDRDRFSHTLDNLLPEFDRLAHWAYNDAGDIVGVCQRFGAFNFVVNTDRIDQSSAEDQGFDLANDRNRRFGILRYDDFNLFHICIGAGLNPLAELDHHALDLFSTTAHDWFARARIVSDDHLLLNRALASGEIDFYISGGVYTVSESRLAGHNNLRAVTPARGSIDGHGAIVFAEITSVLKHANTAAHAADFLEFITRPEISVRIATSANTLNPVAQMADPAVFRKFTRQQLDAIQWDTLSEDISRCEMYRVPPDHTELHSRLKAARDSAVT
ncbi:hypothetical protein AB833_08470 [Chromatiales bacterium (ex Bugula neritina AB1)]|nr:hypothetical protein AB833_08470 [Chromatiales bacterium (ex Bugula neritina AB1)]